VVGATAGGFTAWALGASEKLWNVGGANCPVPGASTCPGRGDACAEFAPGGSRKGLVWRGVPGELKAVGGAKGDGAPAFTAGTGCAPFEQTA
jgi:hypothetical protein